MSVGSSGGEEKKKKSLLQLCDRCCSSSGKVFSFGVLCKLPLQMAAAALLYEMSFCFVIFKNIYISFHVFKVNGLNLLSVCTCKSVYG